MTQKTVQIEYKAKSLTTGNKSHRQFCPNRLSDRERENIYKNFMT